MQLTEFLDINDQYFIDCLLAINNWNCHLMFPIVNSSYSHNHPRIYTCVYPITFHEITLHSYVVKIQFVLIINVYCNLYYNYYNYNSKYIQNITNFKLFKIRDKQTHLVS